MAILAIIYGTGFGNTGLMAEAIQEGAKNAGIQIVIKNVTEASLDDIAHADAIAIGSATYKGKAMPAVISFVQHMKDSPVRGKVGTAFGSYGWSGEAAGIISGMLKDYGMDVLEPGLRIKRRPATAGIEECRQLGRLLAEKIR